MAKSAISGQNSHIGTGTESGYRYLWTEKKWYRYQKLVVPIPTYRKGVGTGTNQSGTGTDASRCLDFFVSVHC